MPYTHVMAISEKWSHEFDRKLGGPHGWVLSGGKDAIIL